MYKPFWLKLSSQCCKYESCYRQSSSYVLPQFKPIIQIEYDSLNHEIQRLIFMIASVSQIQTELSKNCAVCGLGQKIFCSLLTSPPSKIERNQLIQTGLWLEKNGLHSLQDLAWLCSIPSHFSNHVRKWRKKEKQKKKARPGAKLQSQSCCPHRDLGITSGLPYFKHPVVEEHINQK